MENSLHVLKNTEMDCKMGQYCLNILRFWGEMTEQSLHRLDHIFSQKIPAHQLQRSRRGRYSSNSNYNFNLLRFINVLWTNFFFYPVKILQSCDINTNDFWTKQKTIILVLEILHLRRKIRFDVEQLETVLKQKPPDSPVKKKLILKYLM